MTEKEKLYDFCLVNPYNGKIFHRSILRAASGAEAVAKAKEFRDNLAVVTCWRKNEGKHREPQPIYGERPLSD